jgi:ectoine hydroxylase-related dioxygenase (phytanoyl-CoA dioxygenase family)
MALTEEQLQQYYREGYIVVPGLIPSASIAAVLAAAPVPQGAGGGWGAQAYDHRHPETQAGIHRLLVEPGIVDAARSIFGNEPRILYGMLAVVQAHGGTGLPWHQDNQYTQVLGGALNIFAALCDIISDKAILWVAPRSHRLGTQPSQETTLANTKGHREAVVAPENGIPLPAMKAGDVAIFDRNTYHRSLKNETDEPRFAYAAQFQSDNARDAETGQRETEDIPNRLRAIDLRELWQRDGLL